MKRLISWMLLLAMCISLFAGCANTPEGNTDDAASSLADAVAYVRTIYKNAGGMTAADYQRIGSVPVGDTKIEIVWSVDVSEDVVKIVKGDDGMVTIDVNEESKEEVPYVLTATITGADGTTETLSWDHVLPAAVGDDMGAIVDLAYALEPGQALPNEATLTGVITSIDTAWSADYQNITVTIQVADRPDNLIQCYRLKGEGAEGLAVGDTITVTGILKNYNGTIEFDAGCVLDEVVKGDGPVVEAPADPAEILDAAYALEPGKALPYSATLTGVITAVNTPWSADYQNITVTIQVGDHADKPIMCYRLKGEGAEGLMPGDTITVTGTLKNYNGTIEFDAGCGLDEVVKGEGVEVLTDPAEVVKAAYALQPGESLPYTTTLTGKIISYNTRYSAYYQNVTVTIEVAGYRIQCFRLKGEGADKIYVNDTITVTGVLKNYQGKIEFDAGCTLDSYIKGDAPVAPKDPTQIVDEVYALQSVNGAGLAYAAELTGVITKINSPWSDQYGNITVTMVVAGREDKPIQAYRLTGEGAPDLVVGDTITVYGWLTNYRGTVEFKQGCVLRNVVKAPTMAEIVEEAYKLAEGEAMEEPKTLTGVITAVGTEYSSQYKNITVTIAVPGAEDKPIVCYRLKGTGADVIGVGDTITVTGTLKNYKGTIEFDTGCTLDSYTKAYTDPAAVVKAAYALEQGAALGGKYTLTGVITEIGTAYSEQYGNITVTIAVAGAEDMPIVCYRMKGDGADQIAVGDTINVTGVLKNYKGTIEFDTGCWMNYFIKAESAGSEMAKIVMDAYALEPGASLEGTQTLTGVISAVNTPYDSGYKNVSVTIQVAGVEGMPILCYRLKGEGADTITVGDTITVTGTLTNYNGTIEFKQGCTLDSVVKGETEVEVLTDPVEIVKAAYDLSAGESMPYQVTLTGKITAVDGEGYSEQYKNITVTIVVAGAEDMPIVCFRLKGDGADQIAVGDTITVTGTLTNYNGTIEFPSGCTLDAYTKG